MKPYFEKMDPFGKELKKGEIKRTEKDAQAVLEAEKEIAEAVQKVKDAGFSTEKINARGAE